jgi:hypothetical protein
MEHCGQGETSSLYYFNICADLDISKYVKILTTAAPATSSQTTHTLDIESVVQQWVLFAFKLVLYVTLGLGVGGYSVMDAWQQ